MTRSVRPSRLSIDNRIFIKSKGDKKDSVRDRVLKALREYSFYGRQDLVQAVAEHPLLPKDFIPIYQFESQFHTCVDIRRVVSPRMYTYWLIGIFKRSELLLQKFVLLRSEINAKLTKGDAVGALDLLDNVAKLSQSWWGIETRIHVLKELQGLDTKSLIKSLPESYSHLNLASLAGDLLLLSESNSISLYIGKVVSRLEEYRSSAIASAIDRGAVESIHKLPIYFDPARNPSVESIREFCNYSVIDQYSLWRNILIDNASRDCNSEWNRFAGDFAISIGDEELKNAIYPRVTGDVFVLEVLKQYTLGNYFDVLKSIRDEIELEGSRADGLLEVYARSKIYCSEKTTGATFFDRLANEFASILMLEPRAKDNIAYLNKISVKFRDFPWAKSLLFHLLAGQSENDYEALELQRRQTYCLGSLNTPKASAKDFRPVETISTLGDLVPLHRILRYQDSIGGVEYYNPDQFPIYSDYLVTQVGNFIDNDLIYEAINFCIVEYLKRPVSVGCLPVRQLCELLQNLELKEKRDYVLCLVILDIHGRGDQSPYQDTKEDLFEQFLEFAGNFRPSQIFISDQIDVVYEYFLRNLCVPAQLDNIIQFSSNDEVIHERVAIIDFLIKVKAGSADELNGERDRVLENLFSEKLRAKIESGKLYVDVQALEVHRRHIYIDLYEKAKSFGDEINLEPLSENWSVDGSTDHFQLVKNVPVTVPSSKKTSTLVKIFMQAVNDFALNENYGLDKYLSAEVRHIVFVSQLRVCFEKHNLLTMQSNGVYLPNLYWIKEYNFFSDEIVDQLDNVLKAFSEKVDEILDRTNECFRVKVSDIAEDHIFDFNPYYERVVRISEIVSISKTFDEFFHSLIAFMWELAVEGARAAQQLINEVLLVEVLRAIEELEAGLAEIRGRTAMRDLMQEIRSASSDFKQEVELVLNWFRFVGSDEMQTFERIGVVLEAAVSSFQSMFEHKGIELIFTQEKSELLLNYGEARSLFISLFTGLENAFKYGEESAPVFISHRSLDGKDEIVLKNEIGTLVTDPVEFMRDRRSQWGVQNSVLSRSEGGSGIYKMFNLLTNASPGFGFDIDVTFSHFSCLMELAHEYFDHRG